MHVPVGRITHQPAFCSVDELVDISGGGVVWTGEDTIDVYNCCTVCDKRELVYSGSVNRSLRIEGTSELIPALMSR